VTVVDALAHELERGPAGAGGVDDFPDDESEQDPNAAADVKSQGDAPEAVVPLNNWDDEENVKSITEGDLEDCVQSELDS